MGMNFLDSIAPTGLGILGGIGGTLLGGPLGGIAGASAGSALGKGIQNSDTGAGAGSGVLGAAVQGGVGQAGGNLLGGVLGRIGGLAGKVGASQAGKLTAAKEGSSLLDEFSSIRPNTAKDLGLGSSIDYAKQIGLDPTADAFSLARNTGTGANGYLNGVLDDVVRKNGPVDLSKFSSGIDDLLSKERSSLGSLEPTTSGKGGLPRVNSAAGDVRAQIEDMLQGIGYKGTGSLDNKAEADSALDLMRELGTQYNKFAGAEPGTEAAAKYRVLKQAYNSVRDAVYHRPEVDQAVKGYISSPQEQEMVLKAAGGNQALAKHLIDTVNNAQRAPDITKVESKLVDMGKLGDLAKQYKEEVAPLSEGAKGAVQAIETPSMAEQLAVNGVTGNKAGMLGTLRSAVGPRVTAPVAKGMSDLLDRMSPFTGNDAGVLNKVPGALGTAVATSPNAISTGGVPEQGVPMQPPAAAPQAPMSPLMQAYNTMLYQQSVDPFLSSALAGPLASMAPTVNKLSGVNAILPSVEQAYGAAGGGQGPVQGLLAKIGGLITGGPSSTYGQMSDQLGGQLNALGVPASYVPSITQNGQSGQLGFQELQALINAMGGGGGVLRNVPS